MTREKKEYAELLGLFDRSSGTEREQNDKSAAYRYLMSGAPIPRTLVMRLEGYKKM